MPLIITPHFTYEEMTNTNVRSLLRKNRCQGLDYVDQLTELCESFLEPVRARFGGQPVIIHSAFRFPMLNIANGSSDRSQHPLGQAVDFHIKNVPIEDVFKWIWKGSGIPFGQLIDEQRMGGKWLHWSLPTLFENGQVLEMREGKYDIVR